ncbi:MAG: M24 family metallopeptidase, partial [Lachnospiraceae bacterium]|nr:M24 family metallopeptidase [Lachnospiraceae bacterium]
WLKKYVGTKEYINNVETELSISERLLSYRKERPDFVDQSFAPIIATGEHGAIVHYDPTPETDMPLVHDSFLLMDTGGHYLQGTTDITRTVAIGNITDEMKKHYTAVLKGNLNLGAARFKYGCTGAGIDYLARSPLWDLGLDFRHGTGHGVGYLMSVHEGPQRISVYGDNDINFEAGMITSNEPGVYLEGKYGIRTENLILCVNKEKNEYGQFMEFETLTMVPFDRDAIDVSMLTDREINLLNSYHKKVYDTISSYLTDDEKEWLEMETRPF